MPTKPDPEWHSGDPQGWSTYWEAWCKIGNAKAVLLDRHCSNERAAVDLSEKILKEKLDKVRDLGLQIEASCWTIKWRSRTQVQKFPQTDLHEYVMCVWGGRLQQVNKSLAIKEGKWHDRSGV